MNETTQEIPTYLLGADNHNIGNSGFSWFDPASYSNQAEKIRKFSYTAVLSGADSVYNTGVTVANWFGAEAKKSDTSQWITSIDSDLGQYYSQNKDSVDLAGFIATGFIPGMAGVKLLNVGQKALTASKFGGAIGKNMSQYTGLLTNGTENYVRLASAEIASTQASFSLINSNAGLALASGVTQGVLEGAAFEMFAMLPQMASPILDKSDAVDITKNILVGGAFGGVIGGAITGASTLWKLRGARTEADLLLRTQNSRELVQEFTSPADRIILAENARNAKAISEIVTPPPAGASAAEVSLYETKVRNLQNEAARHNQRIDNSVRTEMHNMVIGTGDKQLANMVADSMLGAGEDVMIHNFAGARGISHIGHELDEAGTVSRYVKLTGEDVGLVAHDYPNAPSLADRVYPSARSKFATVKEAVDEAVKGYKFTDKTLYDGLAKLGDKGGWMEMEARHIWAAEKANIVEGTLVHVNDTALLQAYLNKGIVPRMTDGKNYIDISSLSEFKDHIVATKQRLVGGALEHRIQRDVKELTTDSIARAVDVQKSYIEGNLQPANLDKALFATRTRTEEYAKFLAGIGKEPATPTPAYYIPEYARLHYNTSGWESVDGHIVDALAQIKARQKIYASAVDHVVVKQAGSKASQLPTIDAQYLLSANSAGAAPGFLTSAQGGYDAKRMLASTMQKVGGVTKDLKSDFKANVDSRLEKPLYDLIQNQAAAVEFFAINQQISRTTERYIRDAENIMGLGENTWVAQKVLNAAKSESGQMLEPLQAGAAEYIKPKNWETAALLKAHNSLTAERTAAAKERWAVLGKADQSFDGEVLRPFRHDPRDFQHFAFVVDNRVNTAGHKTMLFANTADQLERLITKVKTDFPEYTVLNKPEVEAYKKAHGEYLYENAINENYIDSSMQSKGIYSDFFTETDPKKIADTLLRYHHRSAEVQASEIVRLKYNDVFNWLEDQAGTYSEISASKFSFQSLKNIQDSEKNPYISYIKTALDMTSTGKINQPWYSANKMLDDAVSKFVGKKNEAFDAARNPSELEAVNKILEQYGHNTAFASSADAALINHTAPRGELTKFVRTANSILSRFTLGLDPLNALNNAIGSNVLRGTELNMVVNAVKQGNEEIAGKLAQISRVGIPGTPETILSPAKLMSESIRRFWNPDTRKVLLAEYKDQGFIRDRLEQFASIADDLTLTGTESASELTKLSNKAFAKAKELADAGEKVTGNKLAEEFNRFVSADVMRQITDLGQQAGVLTKAEAQIMINTFVNRVEGNIIASQRPGIFQGPIGQAIGLFQSYQFNMLQNLFRYVAEGTAKDTAMLMGLQGTFYGLQGMPGFKLINDHLVGTASGNPEHRDIYDATRGIAGKEAGNWLLYGTASNLLQTNLYSRGDINPRSITVVPTTIADIPFVGGLSKVFGSLYETANKIGDGGAVWESIRQGIEHNGVSRPLAGLAQLASAIGSPTNTVYSTSGKGTILGSNDLLSLASLSRIAGGRPLDEAILNDTMFSIHAYEAVDRKRKQQLAETVKSTVIGGGHPDENSVTQFAAKYAELGGKQGSFNKYMMEQYTAANTSAAQILFQKLNNPMSYKVQQLMGGM